MDKENLLVKGLSELGLTITEKQIENNIGLRMYNKTD